jgi:GrpB-like predicted nucleotidyltransferase (UPF0157 family)
VVPRDEPIQLSASDPEWPARFELERAELAAAIGDWVEGGIHHVGSTAVPGLEAKPIIDILVGVHDLETARACFEPLGRLGYLYAPYLPAEMHWFCKPDPAHRTRLGSKDRFTPADAPDGQAVWELRARAIERASKRISRIWPESSVR